MLRCNVCLSAVLIVGVLTPLAADPPTAVLDPTFVGMPYQRYTTKDTLGRTITFYLSVAPAGKPEAKLPVVLWIQGSGCQSLFSKHGDKIGEGVQGLLRAEAKGRVRLLVVEKPGVKFLDMPERPGSAIGASEEFLKEHTLARWGEANAAALRAAWTLPNVDAGRTLVMGHSEGGIVAARVAAELPRVTHMASLAGGGPTQLFSLAELQARPREGDAPGDAAKRRQAVHDEWARIRADPESVTKSWLGHPYRRWATFLPYSLTEELLRSKARIYLVHGTEDAATPVTALDLAKAELAVRGRDVTAERLEGADHGFRTEAMAKGSPEGFQGVFGRVLAWFLGVEAKAG